MGVPRLTPGVGANFRGLPSFAPRSQDEASSALQNLGGIFSGIMKETQRVLEARQSQEAFESGLVAGVDPNFDANGLPKPGTLLADRFREGALQSYNASLEVGLNEALVKLTADIQRDPQRFGEAAQAYIEQTAAGMPEAIRAQYVQMAQLKVLPHVFDMTRDQLRQQEQDQRDAYVAQETLYENDLNRAAGSPHAADQALFANTLVKWKTAIENNPWYGAEEKAAKLRELELKSYEAQVLGEFTHTAAAERDDFVLAYLETHPVGSQGNPLDAEGQANLVAKLLRVRSYEQSAEQLANAAELEANEREQKLLTFGYEQEIKDGVFGTGQGKYSLKSLEEDYSKGRLGLDRYLKLMGDYRDESRKQLSRFEEGFRIQDMLAGGLHPDPFNSDDRKGVDQYFEMVLGKRIAEAKTAHPEVDELSLFHREIGQFVQETGVLPSRVKSLINGAFRSGTASQRIEAANLMETVLSANPAVLDDLTVNGVAVGHRVLDLQNGGYSNEEIAKILDQETRFDNQNVVKQRDALLEQDKAYQDPVSFLKGKYQGFLGMGSAEIAPGALENMSRDFQTAYQTYFRQNPDAAKAAEVALKTVQRVYRVSTVNGRPQVMRHAPEAYYGIRGREGDRFLQEQFVDFLESQTPAEFRKQAEKEAQRQNLNRPAAGSGAKTGVTPVATGSIRPRDLLLKNARLVADLQTDREAATGAPSYAVYLLKEGRPELLRDAEGNEVRFKPNVAPYRKRILDEQRREREKRLKGAELEAERRKAWALGQHQASSQVADIGFQAAEAASWAARGAWDKAKGIARDVEKTLVRLKLDHKGDFDPRLAPAVAARFSLANAQFRSRYGFDIPLASAYRDEERNRRAGAQAKAAGRPWGGDSSRHRRGEAFDVDVARLQAKGLSMAAVLPYLRQAGLHNPLAGDENHFQVMAGAPPLVNAQALQRVIRQLVGGSD